MGRPLRSACSYAASLGVSGPYRLACCYLWEVWSFQQLEAEPVASVMTLVTWRPSKTLEVYSYSILSGASCRCQPGRVKSSLNAWNSLFVHIFGCPTFSKVFPLPQGSFSSSPHKFLLTSRVRFPKTERGECFVRAHLKRLDMIYPTQSDSCRGMESSKVKLQEFIR